MKKTILILSLLTLAASTSGCASPTAESTLQTIQVSYAQACAAYSAAFAGALQLRKAGKLNQAQIDQVTLLEGQVTPICTGTLPADTGAATQQITAAVTTLTIIEVALKGA